MESTSEVMTHLTTGAVIVYAIEWLKRLPQFRWITADSGTVNRIVSAVAAAAVAFGITASGDAQTGWIIHIPSVAVLGTGMWEFVKQFTVQQLIWDGVVSQKRVKVSLSSLSSLSSLPDSIDVKEVR